MPLRKVPLANGEYYHIFNRGINRRNIFISPKEFKRALRALNFYRYQSPPTKLSRYLTINEEEKQLIDFQLQQKPKLVDIVCFCLMNNHFHLLLKQRLNNGITVFMNNFQNSYSRYFNLRNNRQGPLWQNRFKNVRVETDEQLMHLSRYIHLNPFTAHMVNRLDELESYPYSSLGEYLKHGKRLSRPDVVLGLFESNNSPATNQHSGGVLRDTPGVSRDSEENLRSISGVSENSRERYRQFVFDQTDYQRQLEKIEHLVLEE